MFVVLKRQEENAWGFDNITGVERCSMEDQETIFVLVTLESGNELFVVCNLDRKDGKEVLHVLIILERKVAGLQVTI